MVDGKGEYVAGKKGVLMVSLGSPRALDLRSVRRYLREFLMDARVIDIPYVWRFLLVNGIIAPFRSRGTLSKYAKIWTKEGSPLQYHTASLCQKLQGQLGEAYRVSYAMRYQRPSLEAALAQVEASCIEDLVILPLFPQYASATTGSIHQKVMQVVQQWAIIPSMRFVSQFHLHEGFTQAWVSRTKGYLKDSLEKYDRYLFSYHGLPVRQIKKASKGNYCVLGDCCETNHAKNRYCYRAQCFATTRSLSNALRLPSSRCVTAFQSRLGRSEWLKPYTEDILRTWKREKVKRVAVFSPAFVSDCLETLEEIGDEYKEAFEAGGEGELVLIPSLNDEDLFVGALKDMVQGVVRGEG